ncbi:hypothetical protein ACTHTW_10885, partial [Neisseria sp. P0018.S006]
MGVFVVLLFGFGVGWFFGWCVCVLGLGGVVVLFVFVVLFVLLFLWVLFGGGGLVGGFCWVVGGGVWVGVVWWVFMGVGLGGGFGLFGGGGVWVGAFMLYVAL